MRPKVGGFWRRRPSIVSTLIIYAAHDSNGGDRLGLLIHDTQRLLRKRFECERRIWHLPAQWRLLVRVVKDEGVPQARLAEILEIEPISVSRLLDRMEAAAGSPVGRRQRPARAHDLPDRQGEVFWRSRAWPAKSTKRRWQGSPASSGAR